MSLENISDLGKGGAGMQGQGAGSVQAALKELQGLTLSLLTGALANTKIDLAAIRRGDVIVGALNNAAGTITDVSATITIVDVRATGTLTLASTVAGATATVNDVVYTAVAGAPALGEFQVGADDTATAANLAAAINAYEAFYNDKVTASSNAAVVTVTATAEGTGPNAYGLVGSATITAGGATLSGGTATGGIESSGATDQIILLWFKK